MRRSKPKPETANHLDITTTRRLGAVLDRIRAAQQRKRNERIRVLRRSGWTLAAIGARYGLSGSRVSVICKGRRR